MSLTARARSQDELLEVLFRKEQITYEGFVEKYATKRNMPGICQEPDCLSVFILLPRNTRHESCTACGATGTVHSGFSLMGMV